MHPFLQPRSEFFRLNLQPALSHPGQVYLLDMDGCPRGVDRLTNLQYLYFGPCYVGEDVMQEIQKAESITELALYKCKVDKLVLTDRQKENIKFLNIPHSVFADTNSTIQCISGMKNIERLGISFSNINHVPSSWQSLTSLKGLYIGGIENGFNLEESMKTISMLPSLEEVMLNSLEMTSLPSTFQTISHLKGIGFIDCDNLNLSEAFKEISIWEHLNKLTIGYTDIGVVPDELIEMKQLRTIEILKASNLNLKQTFKVLSQLEGLEELQFSYCIDATEEETLGQLDDLAKLKNLNKLDFTGNELVDSKYFWGLVGHLTNLEELKLAEFPAQIFPDIFNLTKLKKLDLTFTGPRNMENIDKFPPSLEVLKYSKSVLDDFPMEIISSPNLTSVNLHDNDIKVVPEEISEMKKLIHLDLSYNHLEALPESIKQLKGKLKYLNLMGNPVGEDETKLAEIRKWLPNTEVFGGT